MFVELERGFLQRIAGGSLRIPTLYWSANPLIRKFFWSRLRRIIALIERTKAGRKRCLDFGGGGGVFLPTLSATFEHVWCVDLEDNEAREVIAHYKLPNVTLVRADISRVTFDVQFDVIVAADVLEHFTDLSMPVAKLALWLRKGGHLMTSLPSENWLYRRLRKLSGVTKPEDHYHTAYEVEAFLEGHGFTKTDKMNVPLNCRELELYLVSAWNLSK